MEPEVSGKRHSLLLLTESYPLGGVTEPSFVGPELPLLAEAFDRVVVAPILDYGMSDQALPANVTIDKSLLDRPDWLAKTAALFRAGTWKALWADRRHVTSLKRLRSAMAFTSYVQYYIPRIRNIMEKRGMAPSDTTVYTFWFEYMTASAVNIPGVKVVTRAHGHDIYDSENPFLSHYWRRRSLAGLEAVYVASADGAGYIRKEYPEFASKIHVSRLGSLRTGGVNPEKSSETEDFVFLSVARVSREKRVPLQLECIKELARRNPDKRLLWISVGDGPEFPELQGIASSGCPSNLKIELMGRMENLEVQRLMSQRHVDMALLTSSSEGGCPVAVCEAMSHGIPVAAAKVGGVPEIVRPENGILLPVDLTPDTFASAIAPFLEGEAGCQRLASLRKGALKTWEENFSSLPLRREFIKEISM